MSESERPPRWRKVRFAFGFLLGLLLVPVAPVAALAAMVAVSFLWSFTPSSPEVSLPTESLMMRVGGHDVSKAGGTKVLLRSDGLLIRQDCRDACDDLAYPDTQVLAAEVFDKNGDCLACVSRSQYPWGRVIGGDEVWTIAGAPKLAVTRKVLK